MNHLPTVHLAHVLMLLHALEARRGLASPETAMPPEVFLLRNDESYLWELVGLRLRGLDTLLLAGMRFRRQEGGERGLARASLVSYLSTPDREIGLTVAPRPGHLLELVLPDPRLPILKFLERSRAGETFPTLLVDRDDVELAFDFRLENPSRLRHEKGVAITRQRYLFRTLAGHVLSALPHALPAKLHRDDAFLALREPIQHTEDRDHVLPTLVFHRRVLTAAAELTGKLSDWLGHTVPFHVETAIAEHLLDGRMEKYRAYRERLIEEDQTARKLA